MSDLNKDAVVIQELSKAFETVHAVDKLSVEIHTGEIFGLLGPPRGRGRGVRHDCVSLQQLDECCYEAGLGQQ